MKPRNLYSAAEVRKTSGLAAAARMIKWKIFKSTCRQAGNTDKQGQTRNTRKGQQQKPIGMRGKHC